MGAHSEIALQESEQFANSEQGQMAFENEQPSQEESKRYELIGKLMRKEISLSYSWLKELAKSPRHFLEYRLKEYKEPNEGMIFGSIVDLLITEPSEFESQFKIISNFPSTEIQKGFVSDILRGCTKEEAFSLNYKKGNAEQVYDSLSDYIEALTNNLMPITIELKEEAEKCAKYLLSQEKITTLLDSCSHFQQIIEFEYGGWKFKGKKDCSSAGLIVDLKFMSQLNPDYVDREILKMRYPLQMAVYQQGEETNIVADCYNLVYDKNANFVLCQYDQSLLAYGRKELDYLIHKLDKCVSENLWNESYNFHDHKGIKRLYKPAWVKGFEID